MVVARNAYKRSRFVVRRHVPLDGSGPWFASLEIMLKATIFREYDIRGIADVDLPSDGVRLLGQALGTYIQRKAGRKVNLGRDVRLSGPRLHAALLEGLMSSGCEVTDVGVVPTPLLYYSVYNLKADGAVQITGSHNPAEYNGFKSVCGGGAIFGADSTEGSIIDRAGNITPVAATSKDSLAHLILDVARTKLG